MLAAMTVAATGRRGRAAALAGLAAVAAASLVLAEGAGCSGPPPRRSSAAVRPLDAAQRAAFEASRRPDRIARALGLHPGAVVADVGAGDGLLTSYLARAVTPGGQVVATDIDPAALAAVRARAAQAGPSIGAAVTTRRVAPDAPGLEPDRYDAMLLARVDQYLPDRVAWLRAAARALRPGGRLVIANRLHHRAAALAAARAAGFRLLAEDASAAPGCFIASFTRGPVADPRAVAAGKGQAP